MKRLLCLVPLLFALTAGAAQAAEPERPIVVELYTSQGCSSCPPADVILGRLAQRSGLIAISLPVTYWDMLGWKDTLASEVFTRRQKAYAAAMGHGGVYTPQVIVDGVNDVVGSRAGSIEMAIAERRAALAQARADRAEAARYAAESRAMADDAARARDMARGLPAAVPLPPEPPAPPAPPPPPADIDPIVPVAVTQLPQEMHIDIGAAPGVGNATVWMFHLRSSVSVNIPRGENAGHSITYHNVAADVRAVGVYKGKALTITLPRGAMAGVPHDGVAVIVQKGGFGHVLGAAYVSRPDYYAQR